MNSGVTNRHENGLPGRVDRPGSVVMDGWAESGGVGLLMS
jgi:hypothetical protein